jgi:hypothetical protein
MNATLGYATMYIALNTRVTGAVPVKLSSAIAVMPNTVTIGQATAKRYAMIVKKYATTGKNCVMTVKIIARIAKTTGKTINNMAVHNYII